MAVRYTGVSKMNNYVRRVCENPDELGLALRVELDRLYELLAGTARKTSNIVTSDYTSIQSDDVILVDATTAMVTITLPYADRLTGDLVIAKTDASANTVRIMASGTDTINKSAYYDLPTQGASVVIMPNIDNWYILSKFIIDVFVPYTGAVSDLNLGTKNLTTTGTVTAGTIIIPAGTPATAGASGVAGTISYDASYLYVCVATNSWKRVAIAAW